MKKIYLLALAFAVLTGVAVYFYAGQAAKKPQANLVAVVVAKQRIPERTQITQSMVEVKKLPAEAVNPLVLKKLSDVVGKIANVPIEANEQVLRTKLGETNISSGGLAYNIPEGKRAITIEVSEITGIAGYVKPGDHVDIVASYMVEVLITDGSTSSTNNKKETIAMSKLLVQNIQVLVTGTIPLGDPTTTKQVVYKNITIAVTPEESVELAHAQNYGKLTLVLRPDKETDTKDLQPYTAAHSFWDMDWSKAWIKLK